MKRRLSELEICEKYENESRHSEHVTHLAIRLFDRTRRALGLSEQDRRLLEAACRLHDVGYRDASGGNHATRSAMIICKDGVSGLTQKQRAIVAGIILLHPGAKCRDARNMDLDADDKLKVEKLGAFLRVADGLDHAHIQSTTICTVRRFWSFWRVIVSDRTSSGNIIHARMKADLWKRVFGVPLRIVKRREIKNDDRRFAEIVKPRDSALEAARKLVCFFFRAMTDNVKGSMAGEDPECLHDMRVALRRTRAVLRVFRKFLRCESAKELGRSLSEVCDTLGQARDSQVWFEFLSEERWASGGQVWKQYLKEMRKVERAHLLDLEKMLTGRAFRALRKEFAFFARIEIPRLMRKSKNGDLRRFAARKLLRLFERLVMTDVKQMKIDPMALHEFRRECRRVRYAAEFLAPVLGDDARRLGKLMERVTDALGSAHDIDIHLLAMEEGQEDMPATFAVKIARERARVVRKGLKAWRKVTGHGFRNRLVRMLARRAGNAARRKE